MVYSTDMQADDAVLLADFVRPEYVRGPHLSFRIAAPDDAEFVLSLRTDPEKNRHLSETPDDLDAQREWLRRSERDPDQLYFIIETDRPVGTVRLYDWRLTDYGPSFCWGSWILRGHPITAAVESACMVYRLGLALYFTASHFDVRKANEKVWKFHERMGATRTGETALDYLYAFPKTDILTSLDRFNIPVELKIY